MDTPVPGVVEADVTDATPAGEPPDRRRRDLAAVALMAAGSLSLLTAVATWSPLAAWILASLSVTAVGVVLGLG